MKTTDSHWANISESGSLFGMKLLLGVYRFGGRWLFRLCLAPVILFYMVTKRGQYHASLDYLQRMHQVNSGFPQPRPWHVFRHFWSFAETLLDKMNVWAGKITRDNVVIHKSHLIDELLQNNQGALIFVSHLGNLEVCRALSETRPNLRLTVLHHTKNAVKFNHILNTYSSNASVKMLQVTDINVATAIQLSEKTGLGELIAIAADRVSIRHANLSINKPFLGQHAPFPSGPFILGVSLQIPILTLHCIKEKGKYHIYFDYLWTGKPVKRSNKKEMINHLMNEYVNRLEQVCLQAPWQWYNFYPFWQTKQQADETPDQVVMTLPETTKQTVERK